MTKRWTAELGGWISSLRFSGFTALILGLVIIGTLIVSPTLSTYITQQRELAELRETVRLQHEAVDLAEGERQKWQDPAYVRAQARSRLFYVMPGEKQLSVIEDVVLPVDTDADASTDLSSIEHDWANGLVSSLLIAGLTTEDAVELNNDQNDTNTPNETEGTNE